MELVRGIPITKYCDENHLNPTERLELFIKVCQAIQHAHQKGVSYTVALRVSAGNRQPKTQNYADHERPLELALLPRENHGSWSQSRRGVN